MLISVCNTVVLLGEGWKGALRAVWGGVGGGGGGALGRAGASSRVGRCGRRGGGGGGWALHWGERG